ncbi:MAG: tautomerase family protein [Candidatus Margulisbacteria bacterium]|nr:tautomerase family protein [Candidatus Margulisiibacteriota bacterium]MBU1867676.1 tautomerase family protein [Candidatus Margulisiibacteriota bacterium]
MPIVRVEMWAGRDKETKARLIDELTNKVCEITKCPPEAVIVVIEDIPKENWGQNGKQGG